MGYTELNSRLHSVEMEIYELEGISEEITQMYVIIVVKRLEKLGSRATFEEMMIKNFVKLVKDLCP